MPEQTIEVLPDLAAISRAAADDLLRVAAQAVKDRSRCLVALSGGSTPQQLYTLLTQPPYREHLPWNQMFFFWGDERCVPPTDPESSYGLAKRLLFDHAPVPAENIHRIPGELDPAETARIYADQLREFAMEDMRWPHLDWVLLGLGADGHTASLFPGKTSREEGELPVIPAKAEYQGRPAQRVTLTPLVFNAAWQVVFLVSGAEKADAVAGTLEGARDPVRWPAQRIQPEEGRVVWLVDQPAAGKLKK